MYSTMNGFLDNFSLENLPQAKFFFLTFLNQFLNISSEIMVLGS